MNATKMSSVLIGLLALAGPASAQAAEQSTASRAEVLADAEIWRSSGMAALTTGEATVDPSDGAYREAQARYLALRESMEFQTRVARIAQSLSSAR